MYNYYSYAGNDKRQAVLCDDNDDAIKCKNAAKQEIEMKQVLWFEPNCVMIEHLRNKNKIKTTDDYDNGFQR